MREIWKTLPGHPSYEVSDQGRIKSLRDRSSFLAGIRSASVPDADGYEIASIECKQYKVHRLVLLAFVGPCPVGMQCAHLNGIPWDNRLINLKWVSMEENQGHRVAHGTDIRGEKNGFSKLSNGKVRMIRAMWASGCYRQREIAEVFSINQTAVSGIVLRKSWRHI